MTDLFDFRPKTRRFAVIGNPVAHSKSPQIHQAFARQFDLTIEYERTQVDPGGFNQAVSHFGAHGGNGVNITVPFKVEAWQLCQRGSNRLSARAATAEAVNTLKFNQDGSVLGDNTDGIGMLRDIENNLACPVMDKSVLIIGAGGAVRGVLEPLLQAGVNRLCIVNRTAQKARDLVEHFQSSHGNLSACGFPQLEKQPFDIIINGTAASLQGELPPVNDACIASHTLAYDMMYAAQPTPFMQWALSCHAGQVSDGLGMLVEQAAESFSIWHEQTPQTDLVISQLRKL